MTPEMNMLLIEAAVSFMSGILTLIFQLLLEEWKNLRIKKKEQKLQKELIRKLIVSRTDQEYLMVSNPRCLNCQNYKKKD